MFIGIRAKVLFFGISTTEHRERKYALSKYCLTQGQKLIVFVN